MTLPTEKSIIRFLGESPEPVSMREITRAFGIKGQEKTELKRMIRSMEKRELVERLPSKKFGLPDPLNKNTILVITGETVDGEITAEPSVWNKDEPPPVILVSPKGKGHNPYTPGDKIRAKLEKQSDGSYVAEPLKEDNQQDNTLIGTLKRTNRGMIVESSDKRQQRNTYRVAKKDLNGAKEGDIVIAEIYGPQQRNRDIMCSVVKTIGQRTDPDMISQISIEEAGLRTKFSQAVLDETKGLEVPELGQREDLRNIDLITIDPQDARDFDDAIFAEEDGDEYHLIVAIADVAHYVQPGSALDKEAYERGNSTYFPDRVVPMLPESLSNGLCSLRPHEDRACVHTHIWINKQKVHDLIRLAELSNKQDNGDRLNSKEESELDDLLTRKDELKDLNIRYKIGRGLMQSSARLTYEQAQEAFEGNADKTASPVQHVLDNVYTVYKALHMATELRGALDLGMKEKKIIFDDNGRASHVIEKERKDSHRLVEEFMVLSNVVALKSLGQGIYRIHDKPDSEKLDALKDVCRAFGIKVSQSAADETSAFRSILEQAGKIPHGHVVKQMVLRTQQKAIYSPENIGHFGLHLDEYGHFTSPIRRYADLVIHRMLIDKFNLGSGAITQGEMVRLDEISSHISYTERRSVEAERNATDRFTAYLMQDSIGKIFEGKITGLNKAGLFVQLEETGADVLVPMRSLQGDYFVHDEDQHALIGKRTGRVYRIGATLRIRLDEASPLSGGMKGTALDKSADISGARFPKPSSGNRRRGRGGPR